MRSNGAGTFVGSPSVTTRAALPVAPPCTYPVALNSPHLVGSRVDAMRLSGAGVRILIRSRRTFRNFRNGAACAQAVDVGRVESQFLENLVVVLSDLRSTLCGYLGYTMHLNRAVDRRRQLAAGALQRDDNVVRPQLRVVNHLFGPAHGAERHVHA